MSLRSVGAALLVAVWCVRATLCLSAEHSQWVSLTPLGGSGAIGSPGGTHPIVADGQTVHVVWAEHGRIHYQRSTDAGETWGQPVSLASHGTAQYPCSLEVSEAAVHLIWPDSRDGRWECTTGDLATQVPLGDRRENLLQE